MKSIRPLFIPIRRIRFNTPLRVIEFNTPLIKFNTPHQIQYAPPDPPEPAVALEWLWSGFANDRKRLKPLPFTSQHDRAVALVALEVQRCSKRGEKRSGERRIAAENCKIFPV